MFDNILHQNVVSLLQDDILADRLPRSLLFFGKSYAGKLTTALETARILSCQNPEKSTQGSWLCQCPSCVKHKLLLHPELLILGPRDCGMEIRAARNTFLQSAQQGASYLNASRFLFIRAVRKLTNRFNTIILEGDDKISKISTLVSEINELLEELDPTRELPPSEKLEKKTDTLTNLCQKLENGFLPAAFPIDYIRKIAAWCHLTTSTTKKIVIFENAERMQEGSRNALLKILEEPPVNTIFIIATAKRGAIMPTILSRLRTYAFVDRTVAQQRDVIERVFHAENNQSTSIEHFFSLFLTVPREQITVQAQKLVQGVFCDEEMISAETVYNSLNKFEPRIVLQYFLQDFLNQSKKFLLNAHISGKTKKIYDVHSFVNQFYEQITVYNQSPLAALELFLYRLQ